MFNQQPFNEVKFNTLVFEQKSVHFYGNVNISVNAFGDMNIATEKFTGDADIKITAAAKMNYAFALKGASTAELSAGAAISVVKDFRGNSYSNVLVKNESFIRQRNFSGSVAITANAECTSFDIYGFEYIKLSDIVLKPGDELIIDTDEMTVTLNGEIAVQYMTADSEFFNLNPFENDIIYNSGNANDKVDIKIFWKDSFL